MQTDAASNVQWEPTVESWKAAKVFAKTLGQVPSSFLMTIKQLVNDELQNNGEIRPVTKFQVARILNGPSFRAMFYFATQNLKGKEIEGRFALTTGDMLAHWRPLDIAALIGSYVIFRKCRRLLNDQQWQSMDSQISRDAHLGAYIGVSIPKLGLGSSMLVGCMPHFALCLMANSKPAPLTMYRGHLRKTNARYDCVAEANDWGCASLQVASLILSQMGYGVEVSEAVTTALDPTRMMPNIEAPLSKIAKMCNLWIDAVLMGRDQPVQTIRGEYYPTVEAREFLEERVDMLASGAGTWLDKSKDDISPEKTPALFNKPQVDPDQEFEVPEELADVFTLEEITSMEEEDFDDLLDQVEHEAETGAPANEEMASKEDVAKLEEMIG